MPSEVPPVFSQLDLYAVKHNWNAILLTKMQFVCNPRCYPPISHTHILPPQRLSSWLERAIETSDKGAETENKRAAELGPETVPTNTSALA